MDTDITTEDIDDCNWSTEEIAKLYKRAAKLAGYTEEETSRFKELNNRALMLRGLDFFRRTGWMYVGETDDVSGRMEIVKIPFLLTCRARYKDDNKRSICMTYEAIAKAVIEYLNSFKEPDMFNGFVTYGLEHYYSGIWPRYHQAVIYRHCMGGRWLCWSNANDKCADFETACEHMLQKYFKGKISFTSPEELSLKLTIRGMM